jgi:4-diphosphocytidyl-2-C-methyl-D-erythritol kinase
MSAELEAAATLKVLAPAKVNLALEIVGRRADGYHDLDTVMATIDLADTVRLRPAAALEVRLGGRYARDVEGERELAAEAARALAAAAGREPAVAIEVEKAIPVAAGLGGGSSDAAAALRGLDRLWGLGWPLERLTEVAAGIGSDVPFFLHGGVARCRGRGERVEPLRDLRTLRLLVLVPPVPPRPDKTARRFAALEPRDLSDGERSKRIAHRVERGAPPPTADLWNAFEAVVERTESELLAHYGAYAAAVGGAPLHLAGAGPAVFLLAHERARVAELRRDLEAAGATVLPAQTLARAAALAIEEEPSDEVT